jgi:hypothetical protein
MTSTDSPLTEQQLDEIDARQQAATPDPWMPRAETYPHLVIQGPEGSHPSDAEGIISTNLAVNEGADADFIAHARTDVPALLAEVRRLRSRTLTEGEYNAAWHAVEGAAGEEGADPGTVLHAVLDRLRIGWQDTEETHVVADDSDDPEHLDDCPGCETAAVPAAVVGGEPGTAL